MARVRVHWSVGDAGTVLAEETFATESPIDGAEGDPRRMPAAMAVALGEAVDRITAHATNAVASIVSRAGAAPSP